MKPEQQSQPLSPSLPVYSPFLPKDTILLPNGTTQTRSYFPTNNLMLCPQKNTIYLPAFIRLKFYNFTDLNIGKLYAILNAQLVFVVYYGDLFEIYQDQKQQQIQNTLMNNIVLLFARDNAIKLTPNQRQTDKKPIDIKVNHQSELHQIKFTVSKILTLFLQSDIFLTPFQLINAMLEITIKSVKIRYPYQGKEKKDWKIQFNLQNNCNIQEKVSFKNWGTFGNYDLAEKKLGALYTNYRVSQANQFKMTFKERIQYQQAKKKKKKLSQKFKKQQSTLVKKQQKTFKLQQKPQKQKLQEKKQKQKHQQKPQEKPQQKPQQKPQGKPQQKPQGKPQGKPQEKHQEKPQSVVNFNSIVMNQSILRQQSSLMSASTYLLNQSIFPQTEIVSQQIVLKVQDQPSKKDIKIQPFHYAYFNIPLYKYPLSTVLTVFIPLFFLDILNFGILFQDKRINDRIATIATLVLAFAALIPTIRSQLPPSPQISLIQMLVYLQTVPTILAMIQSLLIVLNSKTSDNNDFSFIFTTNGYFWVAFSVSLITFFMILTLITMHYAIWYPEYNQIADTSKKPVFDRKRWRNTESNLYFDKHFTQELNDLQNPTAIILKLKTK